MTEIIRITLGEIEDIAKAMKEWSYKTMRRDGLERIIAEKMVFKAVHDGVTFAIFIASSIPQVPGTVTLTLMNDKSGEIEKEKVELREALKEVVQKILGDENIQTIRIEILASREGVISALQASGFSTKERVIRMECSRDGLAKRIEEAKALSIPQSSNGNHERAGDNDTARNGRRSKYRKNGTVKMLVLALLYQKGQHSQQQISQILDIYQSEVNRIVNELENDGLVSNDKMDGTKKHLVTLKIEKLTEEIIQELKKISLKGKALSEIDENRTIKSEDREKSERPENIQEKVDYALNIISASSNSRANGLRLEYVLGKMEEQNKGIDRGGDKEIEKFLEELEKVCIISFEAGEYRVKLKSDAPLEIIEKPAAPKENPSKIEIKAEAAPEVISIESRNLSRGETLLRKKIMPKNIKEAELEIITGIIEQKPIKVSRLLDLCKTKKSFAETLVSLICKEINTDAVEVLLYNLEISNGCLKIEQKLSEDDLKLLKDIKEEISAIFAEKPSIIIQKEPTEKLILNA